jgi:photosystem II stability/assembly factor-like uncharacterized protein
MVAVALLAATARPGIAAAAGIKAADLRQNLFATCFVDDNEGWAVGDLGRIFHTLDAGKTWDRQDAGTQQPFVSLACPDKTHVWAAGQGGEISFSNDGGKTWQSQNSSVKRQLLNVAFANTQRGIAVGDFGEMVRTDDGGQTWAKIALPTDIKMPAEVVGVVEPGDIVLYGATFASADAAWVAGEFGIILASSDGGATWSQQTSSVDSTLFGISFADAQHGWAAGIDSVLLATADGGMTWRKQEIETPKGFTLPLYDVQVRGNYGWAIGNSGFLLSSKDAGVTWHLTKVPVQMASSWFRGVSLLPSGHGFLVGARGTVLATDRDTFVALKENF